MNFIQRSFLNELKSAPIEVVMMSRKNCHQKGLDSIVVNKCARGCLTRAFFAQENHKMYENFGGTYSPSLGYHDHKYNLTLTELYGTAYNVNVDISLDVGDMNLIEYNSMLQGCGDLELVCTGIDVDYEESAIKRLFLPHNQLHTVAVKRGEKSAWIVEEGVVEKETTNLITHLLPKDISSENLYERFSCKDEIVAMVENFFR